MSRSSSRQDPASEAGPLAVLVEQITSRLQGGEAVQLSQWQCAHPLYAAQLAEVWPALLALAELERSKPNWTDDLQTDLPADLGDFRIVREIARGGMGVVYEAVQLSLARRVALKVLPFAAALDERHLQRFKNEAQAAAGLHHGNIVPVYFVGCERGVHFYAMQLIDGQSLASVLVELRRDAGLPIPAEPTAPTPRGGLSTERSGTPSTWYRTVAQLGIQASLALEHAHGRGVIHRDIKPANLLIDGQRTLWVTDFGLAQLRQAEASLTLSGDLVGTLRYMSPEQALGRPAIIDQRSDVYSLGATLYELLTLRPAFDGQDRQQLLRRVAFEEPAAPRKLDKGIPPELEIIALKAMQKDPADRYQTAGELADDLQRWLEDRPIQARRPSLRQVAARWARRHKQVVAAVAAVLVVASVLLGAAGLWWAQKRAGAEAEARAALKEADHLREEEKWPEAISAVRRAKTILAGAWADADLSRQVTELERDLEMARRLEAARLPFLGEEESNSDLQRAARATADAFAWYALDLEQLAPREAGEHIRSRSIRKELVAALDFCALARWTEHSSSWKRFLAVARVADPTDDRDLVRQALQEEDRQALLKLASPERAARLPASTQHLLGIVLVSTDAPQQGVALLRLAQQRQPGDYWTNLSLAVSLVKSHPGEAVGYFAAALALRPRSAVLHNNLAVALAAAGRLDEAIAMARQALALSRGGQDEALFHFALVRVLVQANRLDDALTEAREAMRLDKDSLDAHTHLGGVLLKQGKLDEAIAEFRLANRLANTAHTHTNLGVVLLARRQPDEAIAELRQAIRLDKNHAEAHAGLGTALAGKKQFKEAAAAFREALRLKPDSAETHDNLGTALARLGKPDEAIACYRQAIRLNKDQADAHFNLGVTLGKQGKRDEAIACYRQTIRLNKAHTQAHNNLGLALNDSGRPDEAISEFRQAIRLDKDFAPAHYNLGIALFQKRQFRQAAETLRRCQQLALRYQDWRHPTGIWLRRAEKLARLEERLAAVRRGEASPKDNTELLELARFCQFQRKEYAAAARFYTTAFTGQTAELADLRPGDRYNAACAAVLASVGEGQNGKDLPQRERVRLRKQGLTWLQADVAAWRGVLEKGPPTARPVLIQALRHWLADPDLAGVREAIRLASLSDGERPAWQKLWIDVVDLLCKAQAETG